MPLYFILILPVFLLACGDPVERHIADLLAGGPGAEEAQIELNMAKATAITPLITAFKNPTHSARARTDLAQALYRLHVREADPRILATLTAALADPAEGVRLGVAAALGGINSRESIQPLIDRLAIETSDSVRVEILTALDIMCLGRDDQSNIDKLTAEQQSHLEDLLTALRNLNLSAGLERKTLFWLENLAHDRTRAAQKLTLKADLQGAEELFLQALALIPDSKNINQQLGKFYFFNGEREKGLAILDQFGMVAHAPHLSAPPVLDGDLDEAIWGETVPLTDFYPCVRNLRAYRTTGRSEAFVGYVDQMIYIGIRGYEESTTELAAAETNRDGFVHRDDCVEIFLDPGLTQQDYWQINANSLGVLEDARVGPNGRELGWNGDIAAASRVAEHFWSVEVAIPAADLDGHRIESGDAWGLNLSRVRIAYASELGQWVPTYGWTARPEKFGILFFE